ncbi:MAG: hypothetical protein KatS3mg115_1173 [Candidatus Poribacteria bacterium]|nr:MAG: hypothetical protein KatS3mg115_1173 [Candidatus Poribacteria bacterium]
MLFSVGVRPNARLAAEAGLELGPSGGIRVNEYLQTSDPDIFAGGDCVETPHRILERGAFLPLGSLANRHGRIIGDNLTGGRSRFEGALGTTVLQVAGFHVGRTGLTERQAREEGFAPWTALVPSPDHLHYMPTAKTIVVKLIADQETGRLLGGQIVGPGDAIKRTDVLATAIHFRATVDDLPAIDLGYAPPYSFPIDPIQHAANVLRNKRDGIAQGISPAELKAKLDAGEPVLLLDVRTPQEVAAQPFPHPQVVHIPLGALRRRAQTLPRDREIVTFCKISLRGYEAQKILNALGFTNVKFLDGGLVTWPYD